MTQDDHTSVDLFPLRDYQRAALTAIVTRHGAGIVRQLLVLPTGAGKTVLFSHLAREWGCRTLILAHRDELIEQAVSKLRAVLGPRVPLGVIKAERNELGPAILVASVQTLRAPHRLAALGSWRPDLLIIDEAHHASAPSYRSVIDGVGMDDPARHQLLLGVTATPDRADGTTIGGTVFDEIVYQTDMLALMRAGYLCDFRALRVHVQVNFSTIKRLSGDLQAEELGRALQDSGAGGRIVDAFCAYGRDRKALVFTPTVAFAHDIAHEFQSHGITAEALDGTTPPEERRALLDRLHRGITQVVVNCAVLTEGFDEPSIDCIILARPTQSRALYVQMIGRGARPFPGKRDCLVLDLVGTSHHSILSIPDIFALPPSDEEEIPSVLEGTVLRDLQEHAGGTVPEWAAAVQERHEGELNANPIQLFRERGRFHWVLLTHELAILPAGDVTIAVRRHQDIWQVIVTPSKDAQHAPWVCGHFFTSADARACAEAHVPPEARTLAGERASWRREPISDGQHRILDRHRRSLHADARKGDASDAIATIFFPQYLRSLSPATRALFDLFATLAARGITLSITDDDRFRASGGAITPEERTDLQAVRSLACTLLRGEDYA